MKKVLLFGVAAFLIIVALGSLGHMIGLAISLVLVYFSLKQFMKCDSFFGKLFWAMVGICSLFAVLASLPALAGILAIFILYAGYKHYKKNDARETNVKTQDPFDSFDQQWNELKKNYE
ncbi:flagellar basal body rod protein [Heyndrickxia vini]|uniref:Flagellar basal body rod protein n=1 Tax=Heyndrickxia vini TaxID=1476025 RepID=A0ABX7DYP9_9BACI|nr:flagellar basal body rod protein [Heyndrickxia vini]QQZ08104.1 flagellar basal body rod protein [Heyndrickxia vini]